jgi:hypothetical protein
VSGWVTVVTQGTKIVLLQKTYQDKWKMLKPQAGQRLSCSCSASLFIFLPYLFLFIYFCTLSNHGNPIDINLDKTRAILALLSRKWVTLGCSGYQNSICGYVQW